MACVDDLYVWRMVLGCSKFDLFLVFLFYVIDPCRWVGGFDILASCFDANQLFFCFCLW